MHYYTLCVSAAALRRGRGWLEAAWATAAQRAAERYAARGAGDPAACSMATGSPTHGYYRSRVLAAARARPRSSTSR